MAGHKIKRYRIGVKAEVEFDVDARNATQAERIAKSIIKGTSGEAQYFDLDLDATNEAVYLDVDAPITITDKEEENETADNPTD